MCCIGRCDYEVSAAPPAATAPVGGLVKNVLNSTLIFQLLLLLLMEQKHRAYNHSAAAWRRRLHSHWPCGCIRGLTDGAPQSMHKMGHSRPPSPSCRIKYEKLSTGRALQFHRKGILHQKKGGEVRPACGITWTTARNGVFESLRPALWSCNGAHAVGHSREPGACRANLPRNFASFPPLSLLPPHLPPPPVQRCWSSRFDCPSGTTRDMSK